jgi:hypothetical protein
MKTNLEALALLNIKRQGMGTCCPCDSCSLFNHVESAIAELRAARAVVEEARDVWRECRGQALADVLRAYDEVVK